MPRRGEPNYRAPSEPEFADFAPGAERKLLLIKGLGSTSEDRILSELARALPRYSACEFSYRGRATPIYDQWDSFDGVTNLEKTCQLVNGYIRFDDPASFLILAHSHGGILASEWAWRFAEDFPDLMKRTRIFMIASPVRIEVPETGHYLYYEDEEGEEVASVINGPTYPPNFKLPVELVGSCFASKDTLAPPVTARLPKATNVVNYPAIKATNHKKICHNEYTKKNLQDFVAR